MRLAAYSSILFQALDQRCTKISPKRIIPSPVAAEFHNFNPVTHVTINNARIYRAGRQWSRRIADRVYFVHLTVNGSQVKERSVKFQTFNRSVWFACFNSITVRVFATPGYRSFSFFFFFSYKLIKAQNGSVSVCHVHKPCRIINLSTVTDRNGMYGTLWICLSYRWWCEKLQKGGKTPTWSE